MRAAPPLISASGPYIQGDQLNMTVFFCTLQQVNATVLVYTAQVTFYKVLETHRHV